MAFCPINVAKHYRHHRHHNNKKQSIYVYECMCNLSQSQLSTKIMMMIMIILIVTLSIPLSCTSSLLIFSSFFSSIIQNQHLDIQYSSASSILFFSPTFVKQFSFLFCDYTMTKQQAKWVDKNMLMIMPYLLSSNLSYNLN